jgi:flagellar hook-length control protein FliK
MLPTLNLSSLSTAISADGSENNALFSMGSGDSSTGENPFAALFEKLGLTEQGPLNEQDLTAVLTALKEEIGESLPLTEGLSSDGSTELTDKALDPSFLNQLAGELMHKDDADDNPERMTGNELLSYLMANAGMVGDAIPESVNAESDLSALEDWVAPSEVSDEPSIDLEQSEDFSLVFNVDQSADHENSEMSTPPDGLVLDSNESDLTIAATDVDTGEALSLNVDGQTAAEGVTIVEEGRSPTSTLTQLEGLEEASVVAAAGHAGKSSSELKPALQPMEEVDTEATVDDVLESKTDLSKGGKELVGDAKALEPRPMPLGEKVPPSKTELSALAGSESTTQKTSQTTERVLNANLTLSSAANVEPTIEEPLAKPVFEPTNLLSKPATTRPMAETLVQQSVDDHLSRPMKLALASQALAERIQTMVAGDLKQAIIRLDPPELGALELRVQVQQEQTQVQILASTTQVREALEQHSARLREALAEQGLNLSNLDVSDQQSGEQSDSQSSGADGTGNESDSEEERSIELNSVVTAQGVVDHYV